MIPAEELKQIKEILAMPAKVVIISHRNPDGDAIGSSMALAKVLEQMNHQCKVIFPSEYPPNFAWISNVEEAMIFDIQQDEVRDAIRQAEMIFCLDFNSLDRVDKLSKPISDNPCPKMMIDHHLDPEPFADFMLSSSKASSTCELVYDFIELMDWQLYMNVSVVECLYTGILTDTGSFRHATNERLFHIMAELKRRNLDDYRVNDLIHNTVPEKNLRLLGHALLNRMEVLDEWNAAIIHLTRDDYDEFKIQRGDTEGIVNYLLTIKDVQLAAFITEQPKIVKISLRSKYDVDVQAMAREHFNGGGHKNASGGFTYDPLEKAIRRMKKVIPHYIRAEKPSVHTTSEKK